MELFSSSIVTNELSDHGTWLAEEGVAHEFRFMRKARLRINVVCFFIILSTCCFPKYIDWNKRMSKTASPLGEAFIG